MRWPRSSWERKALEKRSKERSRTLLGTPKSVQSRDYRHGRRRRRSSLLMMLLIPLQCHYRPQSSREPILMMMSVVSSAQANLRVLLFGGLRSRVVRTPFRSLTDRAATSANRHDVVGAQRHGVIHAIRATQSDFVPFLLLAWRGLEKSIFGRLVCLDSRRQGFLSLL